MQLWRACNFQSSYIYQIGITILNDDLQFVSITCRVVEQKIPG